MVCFQVCGAVFIGNGIGKERMIIYFPDSAVLARLTSSGLCSDQTTQVTVSTQYLNPQTEADATIISQRVGRVGYHDHVTEEGRMGYQGQITEGGRVGYHDHITEGGRVGYHDHITEGGRVGYHDHITEGGRVGYHVHSRLYH